MNRLKNSLVLTDVDRQRLGTLLTRADIRAVGRSQVRDKLERKLEDAECVLASRTPDTLVTMNSTVVIQELSSGAQHTRTLIYPEDRGLKDGGVCVLQDLGCSLLGRQVGETVVVKQSTHATRYLIRDLIYQPETAGATWL